MAKKKTLSDKDRLELAAARNKSILQPGFVKGKLTTGENVELAKKLEETDIQQYVNKGIAKSLLSEAEKIKAKAGKIGIDEDLFRRLTGQPTLEEEAAEQKAKETEAANQLIRENTIYVNGRKTLNLTPQLLEEKPLDERGIPEPYKSLLAFSTLGATGVAGGGIEGAGIGTTVGLIKGSRILKSLKTANASSKAATAGIFGRAINSFAGKVGAIIVGTVLYKPFSQLVSGFWDPNTQTIMNVGGAAGSLDENINKIVDEYKQNGDFETAISTMNTYEAWLNKLEQSMKLAESDPRYQLTRQDRETNANIRKDIEKVRSTINVARNKAIAIETTQQVNPDEQVLFYLGKMLEGGE